MKDRVHVRHCSVHESVPCIRWIMLYENCCEEAVYTRHVGIFDILDDSVTHDIGIIGGCRLT